MEIPAQSSVKFERPIKTAVYRLPNTASSSTSTSPSTSVASVVSTDSSVLRTMLATEKKEVNQSKFALNSRHVNLSIPSMHIISMVIITGENVTITSYQMLYRV